MVQVLICTMYKLGTTAWKSEFILDLCDPVLASFVFNQFCVRYIVEPYLWQNRVESMNI